MTKEYQQAAVRSYAASIRHERVTEKENEQLRRGEGGNWRGYVASTEGTDRKHIDGVVRGNAMDSHGTSINTESGRGSSR